MKLTDTIGKFKVVKCRCGVIRTTSSNEVFKCFKCGKNSRVVKKATKHQMTGFNVKVLFHSDNEREVGEFLRKYNEKLSEDNEKSDFHSYKIRGD